jgi:hypothetical protein
MYYSWRRHEVTTKAFLCKNSDLKLNNTEKFIVAFSLLNRLGKFSTTLGFTYCLCCYLAGVHGRLVCMYAYVRILRMHIYICVYVEDVYLLT